MKKAPGGLPVSNQKKCPRCGNDNVKDTRSKGSLHPYELDGTKLPEATIPIYRCGGCDRAFLYTE